jgi:hypothetical protein
MQIGLMFTTSKMDINARQEYDVEVSKNMFIKTDWCIKLR